MLPSSRGSDEEDNYENEEEQKRRTQWRRREHDEEGGDQGGRIKQKLMDMDSLMSPRRTEKEEGEPERMGRGKRREILSRQRRKRLAQMLKKRRPSTDEEKESDSESSSEEDRPIRRRLNRINSDDDEDEEKEKERQKTKRSSSVERRPANSCESKAQEMGQGCSLALPHTLCNSRVLNKGESGRHSSHNGPLLSEQDEDQKEKGELPTDLLNAVHNSP